MELTYDELFTLAESLRLALGHHERRLRSLKRNAGGRNWQSNETEQGATLARIGQVKAMRERVAAEMRTR